MTALQQRYWNMQRRRTLANAVAETAFDETVFISPHQLFSSWCSIASQLAQMCMGMQTKIIDANEIYQSFQTEANEAEALWKWIQLRNDNSRMQHYVLCGPFIDGEHASSESVHLADGSAQTLDNSIPGIYVNPDSLTGIPIPSDMFFAVEGNPENRHPWWNSQQNQYFTDSMNLSGCKLNCSISRVPVMPMVNDESIVDVASQMQGLLSKATRALSDEFSENGHFSIAFSRDQSRGLIEDPSKVPDIFNKHTYIDTLPEPLDPAHDKELLYFELAARLRMRRDIYPHVSFKSCLPVYRDANDIDINIDQFYSTDFQMLLVKAHGLPESCIGLGLDAQKFLNASSMCKVLMLPMVCNTGMTDWLGDVHDYYQDRPFAGTLQPSLAAAATLNPKGGCLAGVFNSKLGFSRDGADAYDIANCTDGRSTDIETLLLKHFLQRHELIGTAWMNALNEYCSQSSSIFKRDAAVAMQETLYGLPFITVH